MPNKIFTLIFLLFSFSAADFALADKHQIIHHYQVKLNDDLTVANVNICFDGEPVNYLAIEFRIGNKDLLQGPHSEQGEIETQGRFWNTGSLPDNACLNYSVSLRKYLVNSSVKNKKRKNIINIEDNNWLWIPEVIKPSDEIEIKFFLPKWASISIPWEQMDFEQNRFLLGHQPQEWGYSFLIGDLYHQISRINRDSVLNVVATKNLAHPQQYVQWVTHAAKALENYLGEYPVKQTQIILISKSGVRHGPVPWGDVSRGAGFGIRFVVVPKYPIDKLYKDWTATHEFSHLLLPKIHHDENWLSEGLASYLQYILMAQSGVINKQVAWKKIYDGFQRGERGSKKVAKEPLAMVSNRREKFARSGRTMRIYWSGALYFLKADILLRKRSDGKVGLNDILLKLNHCCLLGDKIWRGDEVAAKLDQLSQSEIFGQLYQEFSQGLTFPEYQSVFRELGVDVPLDKKSPFVIKEGSLAEDIMR